jgi:GDPmannose 4,6-dehydratase
MTIPDSRSRLHRGPPSPLRLDTFVTQKIATGIAKIVPGLEDSIALDDTSICRDWGFAADYVEAM